MSQLKNINSLTKRGKEIYNDIREKLIQNNNHSPVNDYQIAMYADAICQFEEVTREMNDTDAPVDVKTKAQLRRISIAAKADAVKIGKFLGLEQGRGSSIGIDEDEKKSSPMFGEKPPL